MKQVARIKKGDQVIVQAGKDKGKIGKVLLVDADNRKVIVEGVNIVTKHQKPSRANQAGGILKKESPIDISNVMYYSNGQPTKIGYKVERDEKGRVVSKIRINKKSNEPIENATI